MREGVNRGVLLTLLLAATVLPAQQQDPDPLVRAEAAERVAPHTWVISDNNVPIVPNVGIVVGSRATLVIDPGLGVRNGQTVLREVAKISNNAELYVVSTHFHPEHAAGVAAFPATAKYIVPRIQQRDLDELGPAMMERFAARTPLTRELLQGATLRKADVLFDTQYELDLGGVKATLLALGPTHTRGDTVVWVQDDEAGVMFAGDIVMNRTVVAFGEQSSSKAWMQALTHLERLRPADQDRPAIIVPSHGPIGDANLIAYQRGFFQGVQARVRELKEQGKPEAEILKLVADEFQGRYAMWGRAERIPAIVANVYQEMD
jgi:glyoxylase-like metal-dependent hydrolase (beta-lactamase superfamily II)